MVQLIYFTRCLAAFSLHILDGIPMAADHVVAKRNRDAQNNEPRLPGQTLLRNDVVALFRSQTLPPKLLQNVPTLQFTKLPCSYNAPVEPGADSSKHQWKSVLVQYGSLSRPHFATLCASSCMAHGSSPTMCTVSSEPLG